MISMVSNFIIFVRLWIAIQLIIFWLITLLVDRLLVVGCWLPEITLGQAPFILLIEVFLAGSRKPVAYFKIMNSTIVRWLTEALTVSDPYSERVVPCFR